MGEMIREHDQGFRAKKPLLLQRLAAQTSPAITQTFYDIAYGGRAATCCG